MFKDNVLLFTFSVVSFSYILLVSSFLLSQWQAHVSFKLEDWRRIHMTITKSIVRHSVYLIWWLTHQETVETSKFIQKPGSSQGRFLGVFSVTEIPVYVQVKGTKFPETLAWGITVHKVHGSTFAEMIADMTFTPK